MPLYLIPPGKRKGNRFYLVRGQIAGQSYEISTKTTDKATAERLKAKVELEILENRTPIPGEAVNFSRAADLYIAYRDPQTYDHKRISRLKRVIGTRLLGDIRHADLVEAANLLYPAGSAATKNREAIRPAAAILHYAAKNGLCGWLRVPLFKEKRPTTRATTQAVARVLINNLPSQPLRKSARGEERQRLKRLLLLWLFRQGPRISDALKIRSEDIDLERRIVSRHIGKTDEHIEEPLHDEVYEMLIANPPREGWLFPWRTRSGVYKWLRPYTKALGVKFTPHMARHSLGKWLNEDGASLRTIMDTLHHKDVKSSARYQSTDIEIIRATGRRLGKLVGNTGK